MLKFMLMLPLRIICLPVIIALKLVFWICIGILCLTEWVFGLAAGVLALVGIIGIFCESVSYGMWFFVAALLVSPIGFPMLALKLVFLVGTAGDAIREVVY